MKTKFFRTFTFASILLSAIAFNDWSGNEITNVRYDKIRDIIIYKQYGIDSIIDTEIMCEKAECDPLGVLYILKDVGDLRAVRKLVQQRCKNDTVLVIWGLITDCYGKMYLAGGQCTEKKLERFFNWILIPNLNNPNNQNELLKWKLFSNSPEDLGCKLSDGMWDIFAEKVLKRKNIDIMLKIGILGSTVTDKKGKEYTFIENAFNCGAGNVIDWLETLGEADLNRVLNIRFLHGDGTLRDAINREGYELENIR